MSMDETLFADIENLLQSGHFHANADEILHSVENVFETTNIAVERMANEFLSKLQSNPEFDLFFREEAENFEKIKTDCIVNWKKELKITEQYVADTLVTYFDSKLTQHSHRVMNIKNAMSGKVMRLRDSVIQYRIGHELKSEERIREHNRLVIDMVREEKDAEIAGLHARIRELEGMCKTAQSTRLSNPDYIRQITDHSAALERAAENMMSPNSKAAALQLRGAKAETECAECAQLMERIDQLERAAAQNDASSQDSSTVMFTSKTRIVRPSQIVMNAHSNAPSDDDESSAGDSVSVLSSLAEPLHADKKSQNNSSSSKKKKKSLNKEVPKVMNPRMSRVSMVKVMPGAGDAGYRGRLRSEITPIRSAQRLTVLQGSSSTPQTWPISISGGELREEDDEEDDVEEQLEDISTATLDLPEVISAAGSATASVVTEEVLPARKDIEDKQEDTVTSLTDDNIIDPGQTENRIEARPVHDQVSGAAAATNIEAPFTLPSAMNDTSVSLSAPKTIAAQDVFKQLGEPISTADPGAIDLLGAENGAGSMPVLVEKASDGRENGTILTDMGAEITDVPSSASSIPATGGASQSVAVEATSPTADDANATDGKDACTKSTPHTVPTAKHVVNAKPPIKASKHNIIQLHTVISGNSPRAEEKRHIGKALAVGKHVSAAIESDTLVTTPPGSAPTSRPHSASNSEKGAKEKKVRGPSRERARRHSFKNEALIEKHNIECQTDAELPPQILQNHKSEEACSQTEIKEYHDMNCQTDKEPLMSESLVGASVHSSASIEKVKARANSPKGNECPADHLPFHSPDPFASPISPFPYASYKVLSPPSPSKIEISISRRNSAEDGMEEYDKEEVLILEEKVKDLTFRLNDTVSTNETLQRDCSILREKLDYSEHLNQNQGLLFNLKLKERALLLKEMSNQVNILRVEASRRENIEHTQRVRVVPTPTVPLTENGHGVGFRGRGDITNDGTGHIIQPNLSRPPSAPGLDKDPMGLKFDKNYKEVERPKTANPASKLSPFSYNVPASTLLREAVPISTRIKQGKVGGFTGGMAGSWSTSALGTRKTSLRLNAATALREACNIPSTSKLDMYTSSGGKFGRAAPDRHNSKLMAVSNSPEESTDIFVEKGEDILVSSHNEIVEIRLLIGELLQEHDNITQKRNHINNKTSENGQIGMRERASSSPGRQRIRSPLRGRPTSPPMLEKFMQFERLISM